MRHVGDILVARPPYYYVEPPLDQQIVVGVGQMSVRGLLNFQFLLAGFPLADFLVVLDLLQHFLCRPCGYWDVHSPSPHVLGPLPRPEFFGLFPRRKLQQLAAKGR